MSSNSSFLPDDYLDQRADRRTNLISLVLFAVVMLGVFMAFLFTNQKWSEVKRHQTDINVRYQTAAEQITELLELEEQKTSMLQKAELAAALVERVPRSVLLAELINRMPEQLSLLKFDLTSERIKPAIERPKGGGKPGRLKPKRAPTRESAQNDAKKVRPPEYKVSVELIGVAPTGMEVSRYLAELNGYQLLSEVTLEYSEEKDVEGQIMQEFKIQMRLDRNADVRDIEPRIKPRDVLDPMSDELRLQGKDEQSGTVQAVSPMPEEDH